MPTPTEILDAIAARMEADILSRPRRAPKRSEIDADIAHVERRLHLISLSSTTITRPSLITLTDPEWERRAATISDLRARLIHLRAQRASKEVLDS
jgi:hypothetical protein